MSDPSADDERRRATTQDLHRWTEALAAIARTGLGFTQSLYEKERFEEILAVAADIAHAAGGGEFDHDRQVKSGSAWSAKACPAM